MTLHILSLIGDLWNTHCVYREKIWPCYCATISNISQCILSCISNRETGTHTLKWLELLHLPGYFQFGCHFAWAKIVLLHVKLYDYWKVLYRDHSVYVPSQWEMALQCNAFLIGWVHIRNDLWLLKDHTYSRLFGYVKIIARSLPFSRDHSVYVPSQWETTLQCNVVSHWPVTYTKWSMCPANERLCYIVTSSLIGCVHAQNDPCFMISYQTINIMDTTHCLCNKPTGLEMAM